MYVPTIFWDSLKCTLLPELEFGRTHSDLPASTTTRKSGQAAAPASLSARQARERELLTSGTYGPPGNGSSTSADLAGYMASRLQAKMRSTGSTLYSLTWKDRVTPAGRTISALRASAHRTSGSDSSLPLVGWTTATVRDHKDTPGMVAQREGKNRDDQLPRQAFLCGWPTAVVGNKTGATPAKALSTIRGARLHDIAAIMGPARLTASGELQTGCMVEMGNGAQYDPAHSRWIMGLPPEWCDAAVTATLSSPSSRKPSSSAAKRRSLTSTTQSDDEI